MSCSAHCCAVDDMFGPTRARRDLRRYRRNGPNPSTRQLLDEIRAVGVSGRTLLDVGGGVGTIAHELLASGAAEATLVEVSAAYVAAAREEAERRRELGRLETRRADFVAVAADLPAADVVTLDRVICCYPDMQRLVALSAAKARHLYGVVYPRDSWWMRLVTAGANAFCRLRRSSFRVYVHPAAAIHAVIAQEGLRQRFRRRGLVWEVVLYERVGSSA